MNEYVNYVKISGMLDKVNRTESGSFFARIIQQGTVGEMHVEHFYELYIAQHETQIQKLLVAGTWHVVEGKLTIFKSRFGHKVLIDVKSMTPIENQSNTDKRK